MVQREAPPEAWAQFELMLQGDRSPARLLGIADILIRSDSVIRHEDRLFEPWQFIAAALPFVARPFQAVMPLMTRHFGAGRYATAFRIARTALACAPADEDLLRWVAVTALQIAETELAGRFLLRIVAAGGPGAPAALVMHRLLMPYSEMSTSAIARTRARLAAGIAELHERAGLTLDLVRQYGGFMSHLMLLAYHGEDDRPLLEQVTRLFERIIPEFRWTSPHLRAVHGDHGDRRIRIGICGSWYITSILHYFKPLAERLDPRSFEVVTLCTMPPAQPVAARHQILPVDVRVARQAIADLRLDILVYTDVHMDFFYYLLAAARLAPVQALLPGHPETGGLDTIDYFVASGGAEPDNGASHYTEKLIRLEGQVTPYPKLAVSPAGRLPRLPVPADAHLYVCAQTTYKLHPDFDRIIGEILKRDPAARVILFEMMPVEQGRAPLARLRRYLGPLAERLVVLPRLDLPDYLGVIRHASVMLDSVHFSGGNTSFQALQLGLPVVTHAGRFMRGRMTLSMYRTMGFMDLVAETFDDYVALALRVALDPAFRAYCIGEITTRLPMLIDEDAPIERYESLFKSWLEG